MAVSESSRNALLPSFLYAAPAAASASPFAAFTGVGGRGLVTPSVAGPVVLAQAPSEPVRKIEMYSPAFYAACTAGGIASCGLTHMAVTPFDLVKCNMQIDPAKYKSISSWFGALERPRSKGFLQRLGAYFAWIQCSRRVQIRSLRVLQEVLLGYGWTRVCSQVQNVDLSCWICFG